jgi:hypothetical protein
MTVNYKKVNRIDPVTNKILVTYASIKEASEDVVGI